VTLLDTKEGREALSEALAMAARSPWCIGEMSDPPLDWQKDPHYVAMMAISDPAKLAEMIASESRRCGLRAMVADGNTQGAEDWAFYVVQSCGPDGTVRLIRDHHTLKGWDAGMARTILAALLPLPDGAHEQAERVIRGET
jgi:hypothetical protein